MEKTTEVRNITFRRTFPMKSGELIKVSQWVSSRSRNKRCVALYPNELVYWTDAFKYRNFPLQPDGKLDLPPEPFTIVVPTKSTDASYFPFEVNITIGRKAECIRFAVETEDERVAWSQRSEKPPIATSKRLLKVTQQWAGSIGYPRV
jgi:hypothetical protein